MEDTGFRRCSWQTKSKGPQRSGDPVKHSIRKISEEELSGGPLKGGSTRIPETINAF